MVEVKYLKYKDPSSELAPYGVLAKWLGDGSLYLILKFSWMATRPVRSMQSESYLGTP